MSSNMEQIIDEIEDYIEGCKFQPLSSTKIIVNKDEIQELIADLRQKTPEEVKRYQRMISNKEAILADAQQKAETIISQAKIQKDELVREHQIMQQAYAQANEIVSIAQKQAQELMDEAASDANEIRMGAINYADAMLKALEDLLTGSQSIFQTNFAQMNTSLQNTLDIVAANRAELAPAASAGSNETEQKQENAEAQQAPPTENSETAQDGQQGGAG